MATKKKAKFRKGQVVCWIKYQHSPVFMRIAEPMRPYGDGRVGDGWLYRCVGENRLGSYWPERELRRLTKVERGE